MQYSEEKNKGLALIINHLDVSQHWSTIGSFKKFRTDINLECGQMIPPNGARLEPNQTANITHNKSKQDQFICHSHFEFSLKESQNAQIVIVWCIENRKSWDKQGPYGI